VGLRWGHKPPPQLLLRRSVDERGSKACSTSVQANLLFLGLIIVLLFGAKKVPELFASLGQGIREFKKAMREVDEDDKDTKHE
jgi:TatA/E family protein of Tat protein translocase